jgi:hypothetical protein
MKFFRIPDPFGDAPPAVRREAVSEVSRAARDRFEADYPKIVNWFDTYDPLYVLSFCAFYFLTSEQGVDKEAVEGKLDFAPHHLELLQAFALTRDRVGTPTPLKGRAMELQQTLKSLTDDLGLAQLALVADNQSEADIKKQLVITKMRAQTFAIRNWAYPDQTVTHLRRLFGGQLADIISREYGGVSTVRLIDSLVRMAAAVDDRLNEHVGRLRPVVQAQTFEEVYRRYRSAFPAVRDDVDGMRSVFKEMCGEDLRSLKSLLLVHSDLFLERLFTFSAEEILHSYGDESERDGVLRVMHRWSHRFGDLSAWDPKHFLYSNPVLVKPFIQVDEDSFFWVLGGVLAHTLQPMLESLLPANRAPYSVVRSAYLEDRAEELFRAAFFNGQVYRGSQWRPSSDPTIQYENDVLVVIDSTAIVVECKSHLVDPPARRGAEFRLIDTLEDLVVGASDQAQRFAEFLKSNPHRHEFSTRRGVVNTVDASRLVRFIPISLTYENLGFVSANLKEAVSAGLIPPDHALVPSICLTDLETTFEVLDSQAQRIHYLARRAEIETTMHYYGDEMDLLALYADTGFNVGEVEHDGTFISLAMKSKELDPYFVARADGVSVAKPSLRLTAWWREILTRVEVARGEFWTEIAYIFLSVGFDDQKKFERQFRRLVQRVKRGRMPHKHNWLVFRSGTHARRRYAIVGYPYTTEDRTERNDMMKHMAAEVEEDDGPVVGIAVLGVNLKFSRRPYDVLAYVPGHASGAPEVSQLARTPSGPE